VRPESGREAGLGHDGEDQVRLGAVLD